MPEPNINLLNISREEFKVGFMNVLVDLAVNNSRNSLKNYHLIRFPHYSNLENCSDVTLVKLNMKCSSIYDYWHRANIFSGTTDLLYNYGDIITQIRDYYDYPETRLPSLQLNYLKYSFREIVDLVMEDFKFSVIQFSPPELFQSPEPNLEL